MFPNEVPGGVGRHFAQGEFQGFGSVDYHTDPPTSGRHVGDFAQQFINEAPVPDEVLVHMMEHGYVVVWYNCGASPALGGEGCATLRSDLTQLVQQAVGQGKAAVLTPDGSMPHRLAVTAWQFMDAFDEYDGQRIQTFIDTFSCRFDPEGGCGA
jgi:hypothetical protein